METQNSMAESGSLILTRLYSVQRRLRFVRSLKAALLWFAVGSALSFLGLVILWNWNYVPGPWQWLANSGRPRELLWLPPLLALGGFATQWFRLPSSRAAAYRMDQLLDSQERLLTSVDWLLSEKPRTEASERLLSQAANLLRDERELGKALGRLEPIQRRSYSYLATLLLPILVLFFLPTHVGLPPTSELRLGEGRVDQLTEELLEELEDTSALNNPEEELEKLLERLKEKDSNSEPSEEAKEAQKDLQKLLDQMRQQAEAQEKARELLETLAERARQGQPMSQKDKDALEALRKNLGQQDQRDQVEAARQAWEDGDNRSAADAMEALQQELGQSAENMQQCAQKGEAEGQMEGDQGQDFQEGQGDQFDENGNPKGQSQSQGQGQGQGQGEGQGQGGQGDGQGPGDAGEGTTLEEQGAEGGASGRQSLRQGEEKSEWIEDFENLHPPEKSEYENAQTRVQGQMGEDGPRFQTAKEGRGAVTEPAERDGSAGILHYREAAENAILRDEIPADYRDHVRVYFEALDKGQ